MNIYELTGAYLHLQDLLEDPDADDQVIMDTLESIEGELEDKADQYARIIRNFEGEAEALKNEEHRLKRKREVLENSVSRLKSRLFESMKLTGKTSFKTELFDFNIQKNGGALPVVLDVETDELPDELVTKKPNLKAIGEYIKAHPDCKYAHNAERGESLRIK